MGKLDGLWAKFILPSLFVKKVLFVITVKIIPVHMICLMLCYKFRI